MGDAVEVCRPEHEAKNTGSAHVQVGGSQVRMAAIYTENHLADLGALCVDDGSREILNLCFSDLGP